MKLWGLGVALGACAPLPCAGDVALCERTLPEITLAATHNAMSNAEDGWGLPNQERPIEQQLRDGIRGMLLDTYLWEGTPHLCHGFCELGARPLADALEGIGAFLDANPGEVVVLILQDALSIADTEAAFAAAGLVERAFVPSDEGWPTLGWMVRRDRRLLVTRESSEAGPGWYRPFYELGFDTPYDFSDPSEFRCDVLRGAPEHDLFLINHWVADPFPSPEQAAGVNTADALRARVADCEAAQGRRPNLIAVDFYGQGDLLQVVQGLNGGR